MSHVLVQFVEDGLYHVCPKSHVRQSYDEHGLVTAKYHGIFFRAVLISEGESRINGKKRDNEKNKLKELQERCEIKDKMMEKFKHRSPATSQTVTSSPLNVTDENSRVKRKLFQSSDSCPYLPSTSTVMHMKDAETHEVSEIITLSPLKPSSEASYYTKLEPLNKSDPTLKNAPLGAELKIVDGACSAYQVEHFESEMDLASSYVENPKVLVESIEPPLDFHESCGSNDKIIEKNSKSKKYYCPYCRSLYKQFARHIFQVHSQETEVAAITTLQKNDAERRKVLNVLRAKGSKMFNSLQTSPATLIIPRTKIAFKVEDYIECYLCGNTYKKRFLHRHIKRCPKADGSSREAVKLAKQNQYKLENEGEDGNESVIKFSQVLAGIKGEDFKLTIERDPLLREYGHYLCSYYGNEKHLINLIRRKLRQITEVLLEIKTLDNDVKYLADIFQVKKKQKLFSAIKKVCGYSNKGYKRAAMADNMGILLKSCARRRLCQIKETDNGDEEEKQIMKWLEVMKEDYNVYIGKHARKTLDEHRWNKPKTLPITEDIMKLNIHVKQITEETSAKLKTSFSYLDWTNLCKAAIVKILLFNRKRVGDVERLKIEDFNKSHNILKGSITYELLSESEKLHSSQYKRVETRGKHGRGVPILLTKDMVENIRTIIKCRKELNSNETNPYVFGKNADKPFSASLCLSEMAYACGAMFPQLLTGTKLRKHIATATQAFNFTNNDLSVLATFLGHTVQTHSNFYRLPDEATQLAKISVVLQAIDSGHISDLKGKSLTELESTVKHLLDQQDKQDDPVDEEKNTTENKMSTKKLVKILRRTWSTPEKAVMRKCFGGHLKNKTLPTPLECYEAKNKNTPLKCRTVAQIKAWVNNQNSKSKK